MYELSLFTGGLGGVLGTHHLLGWRQIGYVEIDKYCQKIISQRIKDGFISEAPIFSDIRAFISDGYAESYKGLVDVITAGFPCQPFSVAGKRLGENDTKNMWPATIECIRIIRPRFAFMENVPGLLAHPYARRIFGDLAESGYDAKWRVLSAAELGAPHKRDRLWIIAHNMCKQDWRHNERRFQSVTTGSRQTLADSESCDDVPHTHKKLCNKQRRPISTKEKYPAAGCNSWWESEPGMGRVAHGVANRVDRLKALGNGQVPAVVATVWRLLNEY